MSSDVGSGRMSGTCVGMDDEKRFEKMAPGDEAPPGTEGAGEDVCPECNGSGSGSEGDCPECGGTGRVIRGVSGG